MFEHYSLGAIELRLLIEPSLFVKMGNENQGCFKLSMLQLRMREGCLITYKYISLALRFYEFITKTY